MIFMETKIPGVFLIELERGATSRDSLQGSGHLTLAPNTTPSNTSTLCGPGFRVIRLDRRAPDGPGPDR